MRRTIATTLAASLLVAGVACAGPRKAPKPPAPQVLTGWERICRSAGFFAYDRARERDAGYTRLDVTEAIRRYDQQHGAPAWIQRAHEQMIAGVFQYWPLTPQDVRQVAEEACLRAGPSWMQRPTPTGEWR